MKKVNPTAVGLFVMFGVALGLGAVLAFGSGSFFHPKQWEILYFDNALKGLNAGAPVKFRGVTIGKVEEVLIRHNQASEDFSMPVIIAIDTKLAQSKSDEHLMLDSQARLDHLIEQGFRGRLEADSLVTGVLYVGLDIDPGAPAPVFHQVKPEYLEIPTMPSEVQKLLASFSQFDFRGFSEKLNVLLTRLDIVLNQFNVAEISTGVTNLLVAANRLIATPDLTNSIIAARRALEQATTLLKRIDGRVDPLADNVTNTLYQAEQTLADLRRGIQNVTDVLDPNSSFRPDLTQTIEELGNASRAVANLAEFLQRNPNALLAGRKPPKEEP
jgi:paraquat-inducible protein B